MIGTLYIHMYVKWCLLGNLYSISDVLILFEAQVHLSVLKPVVLCGWISCYLGSLMQTLPNYVENLLCVPSCKVDVFATFQQLVSMVTVVHSQWIASWLTSSICKIQTYTQA